jgi:hypothetical protein
MKTFISAISKKAYHISEKIAANSINESIFVFIVGKSVSVSCNNILFLFIK